jgi:hypothetical protein
MSEEEYERYSIKIMENIPDFDDDFLICDVYEK